MPTLTPGRLEALIAGFADAVDLPSDDLASTRCISRRSLHKIFARLRKTPEMKWFRGTTNQIAMQFLVDARLLTPVGDHTSPSIAPQDHLFAVGLNLDPAGLDPLELLSALEPDGVICYFTAYVLHDLTTQVPTFHHVARLVNRSTAAPPQDVMTPVSSSKVPSIGTLRYSVGGLSYYSTNRARQLMPGVQQRHISPMLRIRCTTIEQTLLDGLLRPVSCGGTSVVFEGWERGLRQADPEEIVRLTQAIEHPRLLRRAGYMLEHTLGDREAADVLWRSAQTDGQASTDSLFPGMPYTRIDTRWMLRVP